MGRGQPDQLRPDRPPEPVSYTHLLREELDDLPEVRDLLDRALVDEPPFSVREGGFIRDGYDPEVDEQRNLLEHSAELLAQLEARTKEQTEMCIRDRSTR